MSCIGVSGLAAPSFEQIRFMLHVCGRKPHLDRIRGEWRCVGQTIYAYGASARDAFVAWETERCARADFNARRQA
jgi:hypothetical protein